MGIIKYIKVQDNSEDGCEGTVSITNGGIGYSFVSLKFQETKGYGMDFDISIYGT